MKLDIKVFFAMFVEVIQPASSPPDDDEGTPSLDLHELEARTREALRPLFPEMYPLH